MRAAIILPTQMTWDCGTLPDGSPRVYTEVALGPTGLAEVLHAAGVRAQGQPREAVAVLGPGMTRWLGLPETLPAARPDHPAIAAAAAAGWTPGVISGWTVWTHGATVVVVAVQDWAGSDHTAWQVLDGTPTEAVTRLWHWQQTTGVAWRGHPGISGLAVMRHLHAGRGSAEPTWLPTVRDLPVVCERADLVTAWHRCEPARFEHGWDVNGMYLAAAGTADLPRYTLRRDQPGALDPDHAGYYLITAAPWLLSDRLPDPAGPAGSPLSRDAGRRWVTRPTLRLLDELQRLGVHGGYELHQTWTSPAGRILRPWAETIRDAIRTAPDAAGMAAAKDSYRQAVGLLARPGGRVSRPDWHNTIIAQARTTLWRKLWAVGQSSGRWPLRVETDCVYYAHPDPDPAIADPGLPVGARLGQLRHHRTIDMDRPRAGRTEEKVTT